MASTIFTYDHDPPKVVSPWPSSREEGTSIFETDIDRLRWDDSTPRLSYFGVRKLDPEPQEGPVEYKLHLLLRPRKKTVEPRYYSPRLSSMESRESKSTSEEKTKGLLNPVVAAQSSQPRQERLLHLTTQLLWRLQQSSPLHSAAQCLVDISLPADSQFGSLNDPRAASPAPGLDQSQGALYEIGVSDDGVLEGLDRFEMRESLLTLQSMATRLGCRVVIQKLIRVDPQPVLIESEESRVSDPSRQAQPLWVVEAYVSPGTLLRSDSGLLSLNSNAQSDRRPMTVEAGTALNKTFYEIPQVQQLRISLTGSSACGKSSLLGTLSNSTLDNGRGKSRLSLLKHRHEIASGVTSSIVTEIVGYPNHSTTVVNCGMPDVKSWSDIHTACIAGRIVSLSDTAGHLRYRRTTIRGLVALKPHWTLCCVAADNYGGVPSSASNSSPVSDTTGASFTEQFKAYLTLCLTLKLPLIVVITKMDAANAKTLRTTLNGILTILKAAERQPFVLPSSTPNSSASGSFYRLTLHDIQEAKRVLTSEPSRHAVIVPIVLTSAVTGQGIGTLHALLREVPIIRSDDIGSLLSPATTVDTGQTVFNIDEVFGASTSDAITLHDGTQPLEGFILCGHLSNGYIFVGEELLLGPLLPDTITRARYTKAGSPDPVSATILGNGADIADADGSRDPRYHDIRGVEPPKGALSSMLWCTVRIVSLRDLRQPVQRLLPDHYGTAGVILVENSLRLNISKLRKGMVLISRNPQLINHIASAHRGFKARSAREDHLNLTPGVSVTVYVSTLRAPAIVTDLEMVDNEDKPSCVPANEDAANMTVGQATFIFVNHLEFVRVGEKVLIMPDTVERGAVGLEGIAGIITEPLLLRVSTS